MTDPLIIGRGYIGNLITKALQLALPPTSLGSFHPNLWKNVPDSVLIASGPSSVMAEKQELEKYMAMIEQLITNLLTRKFDGPIIYISSGGTIYGACERNPIAETSSKEPISDYGRYHAAVECILSEALPAQTTVVRLANLYGPNQLLKKNQGFISAVVNAAKNGHKLTLYGDGETTRDYIHENDFTSAIVEVLKSPRPGKYNLGTGIGTTQRQVIEKVSEIYLEEPRLIFEEKRMQDVDYNVLDVSKFRKTFNWTPKISVSEGIKTYTKS